MPRPVCFMFFQFVCVSLMLQWAPSTSDFGSHSLRLQTQLRHQLQEGIRKKPQLHMLTPEMLMLFLFFLRGFVAVQLDVVMDGSLKKNMCTCTCVFFFGCCWILVFWMPVGVRSYFKSAENDEVPNPQNSHHHWLNENTSMRFPAPMLNHVDICTFCGVISNDPNRCLFWKETGKIELTTLTFKKFIRYIGCRLPLKFSIPPNRANISDSIGRKKGNTSISLGGKPPSQY